MGRVQMSEATAMKEWEQFSNPSLHFTLQETGGTKETGTTIAQILPGVWGLGKAFLFGFLTGRSLQEENSSGVTRKL